MLYDTYAEQYTKRIIIAFDQLFSEGMTELKGWGEDVCECPRERGEGCCGRIERGQESIFRACIIRYRGSKCTKNRFDVCR